LEEIALALTEAEEESNEMDAAALTTLNQTVGGVAPYFAGSAYVLSWKSDVNGDKTVTALVRSLYGEIFSERLNSLLSD
jgi:hypothetical protein